MVVAAVVGAGVVGAAGSMYAANKQAGAAQNAQNISQQQNAQQTSQERPFMQSGVGAQNQLNYLLGEGNANNAQYSGVNQTLGGFGSLNAPFTADTMKQYSPAYQFQMQQGQQGVLNQDAGSVGAESGAALKDLTSFNQNYANTAFSNAFNQYTTQQNNTYNRLYSLAGLGQNAASNTGAQGTALAGQSAQSAQNIGNAYAGGGIGVANNLGQAGLYAAYGGGGQARPDLSGTTGGMNSSDLGFSNSLEDQTLNNFQVAPVGINPPGVVP